MADQGIKQIKIADSELPDIDVSTQGYTFRYRIVSEDKNRASHWSPIQSIAPAYTFVPGQITFSKAGDISSIAWNSVEIQKDGIKIKEASGYDIWVRWDRGDSGDWEYSSRINTTSLSLITPTTYKKNGVVQSSAPNRLSVEVYLQGTPIARTSTFLRVYQGGPWTV